MENKVVFLLALFGVCLIERVSTVKYRLVDGPQPWAGRLEVEYSGEWGTVCEPPRRSLRTFISHAFAIVACRTLGYETGRGYGNSQFGGGTGKVWIDTPVCQRDYTSLDDCVQGTWGLAGPECESHAFDVSLVCHSDVRLLSAGNVHFAPFGLIQLHGTDGKWRTICKDEWDDADAFVVCKQLYYKHGIKATEEMFPDIEPGTQDPIMSQVRCTGREKSVKHCQHRRTTNCGTPGYAYAWCTNDTTVFVKLVSDGTSSEISPRRGYLEVAFWNVRSARRGWICPDGNWGKVQANIACRSTGYSWGRPVLFDRPKTEEDSGLQTIIRDVYCMTSTSNHLSNCIYHHADSGYCQSEKIAGAVCYTNPLDSLKFNLIRSSTSSSKVMSGTVIMTDTLTDSTGTICAAGLDSVLLQKMAQKICGMMGYGGGEAEVTPRYGTRGSLTWMLDTSGDCSDPVAALTSCGSWQSSSYCYSGQYNLAVACHKGMKLVHGTELSDLPYGDELRVWNDNHWSKVCSDSYLESDDITRICGQLGYKYGQLANSSYFPDVPELMSWVTKFRCEQVIEGEKPKHGKGCRFVTSYGCPYNETIYIRCSQNHDFSDFQWPPVKASKGVSIIPNILIYLMTLSLSSITSLRLC